MFTAGYWRQLYGIRRLLGLLVSVLFSLRTEPIPIVLLAYITPLSMPDRPRQRGRRRP